MADVVLVLDGGISVGLLAGLMIPAQSFQVFIAERSMLKFMTRKPEAGEQARAALINMDTFQ